MELEVEGRRPVGKLVHDLFSIILKETVIQMAKAKVGLSRFCSEKSKNVAKKYAKKLLKNCSKLKKLLYDKNFVKLLEYF